MRLLFPYSLLAMGLVSAVFPTRQVVAKGEAPAIRIPLMKDAPTVDGAIGEEEWQDAARMEGLCGRDPEHPARLAWQKANFRVGCDGERLWIAMESVTPPGNQLLSRVAPLPAGRNARVAMDDAVELIIAPPGAKRYRLLVNARGALATEQHEADGKGSFWESGVASRSRVQGDRWSLEMAIPLQNLGLSAEAMRKGIGLSVGRIWKRAAATVEKTYWGDRAPEDAAAFPQVVLDPAAPAVQCLQVIDDEKRQLALVLKIANPHSKPLPVNVTAEIRPQQSAPATSGRKVVLPPNGSETLHLRLPGAHDPAELMTVSLVAEASGKPVYRRDFVAQAEPPEALWALDATATAKVDVRYAYFPSFNEMKLAVSFKALHQKDAVKEVVFSLLDAGGKVLAQTSVPPSGGTAAIARWKVPELPEGEYRLRTRLVAPSEIPEVEHRLVRHRFDWEGNALGMSDRLVPPFTPLEVKDGRVHAVLRQHRIGETGLWDQVESAGEPLLAAPMRLEGRKGEQALLPQGGTWEVKESSPTNVETTHRFRLGTLEAQVATRWEMDGTMFWELTLPSDPEGSLEDLSLVIPIRNEVAPLFHACTDGLRFNFAGALAMREGSLWKSTDAPRSLMRGNYVPYLWLGGELRGVSVFGENDRGWITRAETPVQEVIRREGRMELHCRLISGAAGWKEPRVIRIGFLATPVKPMPEKWRTTFMGAIPVDVLKNYGERIRQLTFIGSTGSYGSAIQAAEPAPRRNDFTIWDRLGRIRRTGEADPELVPDWIKGSTGIYAESNPPAELNYGAHVLRQQPAEVLVYTNARGVRLDTPEGQTFLDEWVTPEYSNRKVRPLAMVAYTVDPGRSYQDWMMWLYGRMMDRFADHIYWDDVFLAANFDLATSEAYEGADGLVVPAAGVVNMRNFIKRTAVLAAERGKEPFNMAHMTNTAIAPILSFSQLLYSWEDKMGIEDFQDRWPMDYVRAETIGRQHGAVPIVMNLISTKTKEPVSEEIAAWAARTATGVMLTHELRVNSHRPEYWEGMRPLLAFGYGTPETAVHNYWEKDYPITIGGGETSSLLLTREGEALLVICDYSQGGLREVRLDAGKLGALTGVRNVASGESLPVSNGAFSFRQKKHDYAIFSLKFDAATGG